jgi:hypothetical protein
MRTLIRGVEFLSRLSSSVCLEVWGPPARPQVLATLDARSLPFEGREHDVPGYRIQQRMRHKSMDTTGRRAAVDEIWTILMPAG